MNIILFILMIIHAVWIIGFQTFGLFRVTEETILHVSTRMRACESTLGYFR